MRPVPNNFQIIYEYLDNKRKIDIYTTELPVGYVGEQFKGSKDRVFNAAVYRK